MGLFALYRAHSFHDGGFNAVDVKRNRLSVSFDDVFWHDHSTPNDNGQAYATLCTVSGDSGAPRPDWINEVGGFLRDFSLCVSRSPGSELRAFQPFPA